MNGIRTPADLQARCTVLPSGCWRYNGASSDGQPKVWLGAFNATVTLGVLACYFATGKRPEKGQRWHSTCSMTHCANPAHRTCGTAVSSMTAPGMARQRTPLQRQRIAQGKRRGSPFTEAVREAVRKHPGTIKEAAAAHGMSFALAQRIRKGRDRVKLAIDAELPKSAIVTIAPPMRDRFAPVPGEFVPLFSMAGIGRDVRTGASWAAGVREAA